MKALRDLTLGQYRPGDSPIHRLDPRAKIVACLLTLITVFLPGPSWGVTCTWPLLGLGLAASRIPVGRFFQGIRAFRWLFAFTCILHSVTTPGQSLVSVPFIPAVLTVEGLLRGGWVAVELATAIACSSLLTLTTTPADLVWASERLASPLARVGVPVGDFCAAILVALRFLPVLGEEAEQEAAMLRAQDSDGGKGRLTASVRGWTLLLVPLLRRALRRTESLARDMDTGGYRPGASGTSSGVEGVGRSEVLVLGGALLTMVAALGFGQWGAVP